LGENGREVMSVFPFIMSEGILHQLDLRLVSSATPPPTDVGEDAGKKEPSYTVGGNVN
jgi:hypothetical protein